MKKLLLLTFLGLMSWSPSNAQYCASVADSTLFMDITRVTMSVNVVNRLDNITSLNSLSGSHGNINVTGNPGRYANYTSSNAPVPTMEKGGKPIIGIKRTRGSSGEYSRVAVFFDWNQDNDFVDADEKYTLANTNDYLVDSLNFEITVPTAANMGKTRMRIVSRRATNLADYVSCGNVTSSDNEGETEDYSVEIVECQSQMIVNGSNISHPKCFKQASGSISVNATGGTPPYTYNWSNGIKTIQNSNLLGGTYRITVSDKNGCTATMSFEIMEPNKLSLVIIKSSTNSLEALVSGGTITTSVGYSYSWNNGQPSLSKITNLTKGLYCVTVTDVFGCNIVGCDSIVGSGSSNLNSINQNSLSISPNPTQNIATIEVNLDKASKLSYTLFNIQGQLIRQEELANKAIGNVKQEINLEGLNAGIYILNLSINGKETSFKVVKE